MFCAIDLGKEEAIFFSSNVVIKKKSDGDLVVEKMKFYDL